MPPHHVNGVTEATDVNKFHPQSEKIAATISHKAISGIPPILKNRIFSRTLTIELNAVLIAPKKPLGGAFSVAAPTAKSIFGSTLKN